MGGLSLAARPSATPPIKKASHLSYPLSDALSPLYHSSLTSICFCLQGITERITEVIGFSGGYGGRWMNCEGWTAHLYATTPILTSGNHWCLEVNHVCASGFLLLWSIWIPNVYMAILLQILFSFFINVYTREPVLRDHLHIKKKPEEKAVYQDTWIWWSLIVGLNLQ
jgi:hypothetical protein